MAYSYLSSEIHLHQPPQPSYRPQSSTTYIIYFITGNPGLIEYYRVFLSHLYALLTSTTSNTPTPPTFHIYGRSLSGFETSPLSQHNHSNPPPYSLQDQIRDSSSELENLVRSVRESEGAAKNIRVILMGHSVGAYILLEITRLLRKKAENALEEESVRIVGGICLFPTVTHIAKSASGRKSGVCCSKLSSHKNFIFEFIPPPTLISHLSYLINQPTNHPQWLLTLPHFARISSFLAFILTYLIPTSFLTLLIATVLRFPSSAAKVTASFIKSPHGVYQALHLARDEMLQITSDSWDTEIWGAAHVSTHAHARPIIRFLFAEEDHWVANETRDELIRARGLIREGDGGEEEDWKPVMEIDEEEGWPHGFCIKHSVPVAERVFGYVKDIVEKDLAVL
jgi:pimeloyl-ACP methyl ester carboxylesterase